MNRREKSSSHSTLDSSWTWPKLRRLSTLLPVDVSYCICQTMFLNVLSAVSMKSYKLNTYLKDNASRDVSYFSRQASKNLALVEQVPISQDFTRFVFSLFYTHTHTDTLILFYLQNVQILLSSPSIHGTVCFFVHLSSTASKICGAFQ